MLTERALTARKRQTTGQCPIKDCEGHLPNVPMMRKVLDAIRTDPNSWFQGEWVYLGNRAGQVYDETTDDIIKQPNRRVTMSNCGTAYCIAGHTCEFSADPLKRAKPTGMPMAATEQGYSVSSRARHELGLTTEEGDELFEGDNSFHRVKMLCGEFAALVGETL